MVYSLAIRVGINISKKGYIYSNENEYSKNRINKIFLKNISVNSKTN